MKKKRKSAKSKKALVKKEPTINVVVQVDASKTETRGEAFGENEADRSLRKMRYSKFL